MTSSWTNQATRTRTNAKESTASRSVVCFEVLDYDSLTYVSVGEEKKNVVALIYKKVTITHSQKRKYQLSFSNANETNIKDYIMGSRPIWELDNTPATDEYEYEGKRDVEYIFALIVGEEKHTVSLGTMSVTVSGSYNLSGTDGELKQDAASPVETGPACTVTGNRLYGVSVNCGEKAVTYSYDIEEFKGNISNELPYDSPINAEDYNGYWTKIRRAVGAMNYYGKSDSTVFEYGDTGTAGTAGTLGLPHKVMAVNYKGV